MIELVIIVSKRFLTNLVLKGLLQNGKYIENDGLSYGKRLTLNAERLIENA
jgi:hypothetical protein